MMRLARTATLLVAFSLLTSAATAHAECAWVLWEEILAVAPNLDAMTKTMGIVGAGQTPQDCDSLVNSAVVDKTEELRPLGQVTAKGDKVNLVQPTGGLWFYRYLCLPDTVDPRGPKGK